MLFFGGLAILLFVGWTIWRDYSVATGTPQERLLGAFQHLATLLYNRLLAVASGLGLVVQTAVDTLGSDGIKQLLMPYMPEVKILATVAAITLVGAVLRTMHFGFEKPPEN